MLAGVMMHIPIHSKGIVFPDTVARHLKKNARTRSTRADRRIRELVQDITRQSIIYSNEHSQETYLPRGAGATVEEHVRVLVSSCFLSLFFYFF